VLLFATVSAVAQANDPHRAAALLASAREAEQSLSFEQAERDYRAAHAAAPQSRVALRAQTRLRWLLARRHPAQGYGPLADLVRARRRPLDLRGAAEFEGRVSAMPEGVVKRESLLVLGETFLRRLARPDRAIPHYRGLLSAPGATDEERRLARIALAEAVQQGGDSEGALAELEGAGLGMSTTADRLRRAQARSALRRVSFVLLAVALVFIVVAGRPWGAGRSGARRALSPRRWWLPVYVVGVPAAVAGLYDPSTLGAFGLFFAGSVPLLALSVLSGEALVQSRASPGLRRSVAAAVVVAHLPLGYLVLEHVDGLRSFGL
jgi:uncharacterized MAPEG superfamily protein